MRRRSTRSSRRDATLALSLLLSKTRSRTRSRGTAWPNRRIRGTRTEPRSWQSPARNLTAMLRRWAPYAIAVAGAIAITVVIAAAQAFDSIAGLSAPYLLLVLWLGARFGRWPAVTASTAAFLLYDFFFVPPVGTFAVRGPSELLELVVLLAVALVTGQLAASLRRTHAGAEVLAPPRPALF